MSDPPEIARVRRVFADALSVPAPDPDVDIIEAGLIDSLALVTLLFELEREFDVELPLETLDVDDFRTIADIGRTLGAVRHKASA
jgi:D-alanine--poly(phosphoribitol) ligase subunit 2